MKWGHSYQPRSHKTQGATRSRRPTNVLGTNTFLGPDHTTSDLSLQSDTYEQPTY